MFFYVSNIFHDIQIDATEASLYEISDEVYPLLYLCIILIFISKSVAVRLPDGSFFFLQVHVYHQPWRKI
jgi:hypothetical protein